MLPTSKQKKIDRGTKQTFVCVISEATNNYTYLGGLCPSRTLVGRCLLTLLTRTIRLFSPKPLKPSHQQRHTHTTMRNILTLPILALFALVALVSADRDWDNQVKCGKRFPNIQQIITAFCNHPHNGDIRSMQPGMMVPSTWAQQGIGYTGRRGNRFRVAVESTCRPGQWLPFKYCVSQFNEMCANTPNTWGYATKHYGNSGCQKFVIGPRKSRAGSTMPLDFCPFTDAQQCKDWKKSQTLGLLE